jgi:hypothetical protein
LHFPCDARACIMKELYIERHVILYDRVCRIAPQRSEYGRSHALRGRSSLFPLRHVDAPPSVSTVSPAELVPSNFSQASVLQFLHCSSPPFHMSLFVPRHIRRHCHPSLAARSPFFSKPIMAPNAPPFPKPYLPSKTQIALAVAIIRAKPAETSVRGKNNVGACMSTG